ncbi:hypothetical protein [Microbacterium hydrothermale]|nr:hypothetical protein [Microbacterium hydrothermale]
MHVPSLSRFGEQRSNDAMPAELAGCRRVRAGGAPPPMTNVTPES